MVDQLTPMKSSKHDANITLPEVGNKGSVRHLYLQGIRAMIRYQPCHFSEFMEIVVDRLLLVCRWLYA